MSVDLDALEQASRRDISGKPGGKAIEPNVLGCILASAWAAQADPDSFPIDRLLELVSAAPEIPASVTESLHQQARLEGNYLEETTEMVVAAQSLGLVGRVNPSNVAPLFKVDSVKAGQLLQMYAQQYPSEVVWARQAIDIFLKAASAE